jgi:hypothetical protein
MVLGNVRTGSHLEVSKVEKSQKPEKAVKCQSPAKSRRDETYCMYLASRTHNFTTAVVARHQDWLKITAVGTGDDPHFFIPTLDS